MEEIQFPPEIGDQICNHQKLNINGNEVYYACSKHDCGNYEFIWKDQKSTFLMIIRAAKWVIHEWAMGLLRKINETGRS